jgi:hypothetical protein
LQSFTFSPFPLSVVSWQICVAQAYLLIYHRHVQCLYCNCLRQMTSINKYFVLLIIIKLWLLIVAGMGTRYPFHFPHGYAVLKFPENPTTSHCSRTCIFDYSPWHRKQGAHVVQRSWTNRRDRPCSIWLT